MKVVTNTRVSDSKIKIRPKVFNSELDYKLPKYTGLGLILPKYTGLGLILPKYTGLGLIFKGDVKLNGSIASCFSKDSYIETNVNLNALNNSDIVIFRTKFRQRVFDSYFVNTLGSNSCQINGVYSNGVLSLCNSDHNLSGSTNILIFNIINI